jgi:hypothetical protein
MARKVTDIPYTEFASIAKSLTELNSTRHENVEEGLTNTTTIAALKKLIESSGSAAAPILYDSAADEAMLE